MRPGRSQGLQSLVVTVSMRQNRLLKDSLGWSQDFTASWMCDLGRVSPSLRDSGDNDMCPVHVPCLLIVSSMLTQRPFGAEVGIMACLGWFECDSPVPNAKKAPGVPGRNGTMLF